MELTWPLILAIEYLVMMPILFSPPPVCGR
jgi:hypothetical protein